MELIGYGSSIQQVESVLQYPDGPGGTLCETLCSGRILFSNGTNLSVQVDTHSDEALRSGKDIYELEIYTEANKNIPVLVLYDFVRLRDGGSGVDIATNGLYGRQEFVDAFVRSVQSRSIGSDLVTCEDAKNIQCIIDGLLHA